MPWCVFFCEAAYGGDILNVDPLSEQTGKVLKLILYSSQKSQFVERHIPIEVL